MNFGHVPQPLGVWAGIAAGLLAGAMRRGGYDWAEVSSDLATGHAQLWIADDGEPRAAMVTRLDGDTMEVWLAGGAVLSGCVPFLDVAIEAAKQAGAANGRITGRRGWQRVLARFGWRVSGDDLVKDFAKQVESAR